MKKIKIPDIKIDVNFNKDELSEKISNTGDEIKAFVKDKTKDSKDFLNDKIEDLKSRKSNQQEKKKKEQVKNKKISDIFNDELNKYNNIYTMMKSDMELLYQERLRSIDLIQHITVLVNSIANRPKEFETDIAYIQVECTSFKNVCDYTREELEIAKRSALEAGAGITAGMAILNVAPSTAMWVATTFGTASTGTAISSLSGAAASNAAIAWLGGGSLAAGGGGMAAGKALLALAGPVGWSVAGVTLLSSIVLYGSNKIKKNKKMMEDIEALQANINQCNIIDAELQMLIDEVVKLRYNLKDQYTEALKMFDSKYISLSRDEQLSLGVLVNNTKSLAACLNKTISDQVQDNDDGNDI